MAERRRIRRKLLCWREERTVSAVGALASYAYLSTTLPANRGNNHECRPGGSPADEDSTGGRGRTTRPGTEMQTVMHHDALRVF